MNRHKSIVVLLSAAALASCNYEKNAVQDILGPPPEAAIRFFNFGVLAPNVNFYANATKLTAVSVGTCTAVPPAIPSDACMNTGAESALGVGFGGVGSSGLYSTLAPAGYTFSGRISAVVDKDLPISTVTQTLANGKKYSMYQSGFYNTTTKTVESFIVEDPVPAQDWAVAHVRFVHAISNANPMTLHARHQATGVEYPIGGPVAYMAAGTFTNLPSSGLYDLFTRYVGSATNVLTRTGVSFGFGAAYSITARGDILTAPNTTACPATSRTCLDNTSHR